MSAPTKPVLVFGLSGQLAVELSQRLPGEAGVFVGRDRFDLTGDLDQIDAILSHYQPRFVVNATAYTAVDRAENEEEIAFRVNAHAVERMARVCTRMQVPFVHVSTDYVFPGDGDTPYRETDPIAPSNAYGRSKAEGERLVLALDGPCAIIRTSWVFSQHGANFVKTMARLAAERDSLSVVADQYGRPTWAGDLADACLHVADQLSSTAAGQGIWHFANTGVASWADLAEEVFKSVQELTGKATTLNRIATSDYPTPARRPAWSVLSTERIEASGFTPAPWRPYVRNCVRALV